MFNIFKKVKNKVNTSEKDYSLSYDNLAIPEIHKVDSDNNDDVDISSDMVPGDNTDKPHVTYDLSLIHILFLYIFNPFIIRIIHL